MEIFNRTDITHIKNGVGERRGAVGHLQAGRVLQGVVQHHRVGDSVVRMWGAGQARGQRYRAGQKVGRGTQTVKSPAFSEINSSSIHTGKW